MHPKHTSGLQPRSEPSPTTKTEPVKPAIQDQEAPPPISLSKTAQIKALQALTFRVDGIQEGLDSSLGTQEDQCDRLQRAILMNQTSILQLIINLKLTITAVERLAKGKSLGALGLPGDEEWNPPA